MPISCLACELGKSDVPVPIHATISLGHIFMIIHRFSPLALSATFATSGLLNGTSNHHWAPMAWVLISPVHSLSGHELKKEHTRRL
jgi:hypothetical protein